eukprot:TRINITY_DN16757_c0_g1_i3.p1 TRINITY_DN16757_c0_g1~~TRINITY_DN16757_c0_g1_i3.p1  ORF type:complete len:339 (+),score=72.70 TRINITY_DN16757_c0_g1_i3:52-1068(+)
MTEPVRCQQLRRVWRQTARESGLSFGSESAHIVKLGTDVAAEGGTDAAAARHLWLAFRRPCRFQAVAAARGRQAGTARVRAELVASLRLLQRMGTDVGQRTLTSAMGMAARARDLPLARELWERLRLRLNGAAPSPQAYAIIIAAESRAHSPHGGPQTAKAMLARVENLVHDMHASCVQPTVQVVTSAISALARARESESARALLLQQDRNGVRPDARCFTAAISACTDSASAVRLVELMQRRSVHTYAPAYNAAARVCAASGDGAAVQKIADTMVRSGFDESVHGVSSREYIQEMLLARIRVARTNGDLKRAMECWQEAPAADRGTAALHELLCLAF